MKDFYAFDIKIKPEQCSALVDSLSPLYESLTSENSSGVDTLTLKTRLQIKPFIGNVFHIQEAETLKEPDLAIETTKNFKIRKDDGESIGNIYGKAHAMKAEETSKVADFYESMSNIDAHRIVTLKLNINGTITMIEELPEQVKKHHGLNAIEDITMDHISSYLECEHKVTISDAQKKFLRTQWNQASLMGVCTTFSSSGFQEQMAKKKDPAPYHVFSFDKNNKLTTLQYTYSVENPNNSQSNGTFTTTTDISNLQEQELRENSNPWIPEHSAKSVSISYFSDNTPCAVNSSIHNKVQQNAQFNNKRLVNAYYKATMAVRRSIQSIGEAIYNIPNNIKDTINNAARWISEKYNSFKSSNKRNSFNSVSSSRSTLAQNPIPDAVKFSGIPSSRSSSHDSNYSFVTAQERNSSIESFHSAIDNSLDQTLSSITPSTTPPRSGSNSISRGSQ